MTDLTTTQKIKIDLREQIRQAEQQSQTLNTAALIRWLKGKLSFYESSWYPQYKCQNEKHPVVQFEREPDEHLLDASNDTLSGSLRDAGFGSGGVL